MKFVCVCTIVALLLFTGAALAQSSGNFSASATAATCAIGTNGALTGGTGIVAEAARCAGEQGKFWEYHDALFADQSKLKEAEPAAHARTLGLDENSFQSCLASGKYKAKVEADLQDGSKAGVAGTPGFFINGVFLSGAQPQSAFEKIIDNQLALLGNQRSMQ